MNPTIRLRDLRTDKEIPLLVTSWACRDVFGGKYDHIDIERGTGIHYHDSDSVEIFEGDYVYIKHEPYLVYYSRSFGRWLLGMPPAPFRQKDYKTLNTHKVKKHKIMKISAKENAIDFFRQAHKEIKHTRKDGVTDYFDHHIKDVMARAVKMVKGYVSQGLLDTIEVAASAHDYFEDVIWDKRNSKKFRYQKAIAILEGFDATQSTFELTNVYISKHFPYLSRAARKELEKARLAKIGFVALVVKVADVSSNCEDDPKPIWVKEKIELLDALSKSDQVKDAWLVNAIDDVREKLKAKLDDSKTVSV